jgi:hypothetical protein
MKFPKLEENQKRKSYLILFLDLIMQKKNPQKTHFGNIGALDMRFYSIALKFEPRVHKEF